MTIRRVRVVMVNFNGGGFLDRSIAALLATGAEGIDVDIVVVDNASADASVDDFESRFPIVHLIRSATNLGFSGGNNLALADLRGVDAVALVNSDCFVEPGWLTPLVDTLQQHPMVGAVSPKILFDGKFHPVALTSSVFVPGNGDGRTLGVRVHDGPTPLLFSEGFSHPESGYRWTSAPEATCFLRTDGAPTLRLAANEPTKVTVNGVAHDITADPTDIPVVTGEVVDVINNTGNALDMMWWGTERGFGQVDRGQFDTAETIPGWCGACVLLRTNYLHEIGSFDPAFFLYFEDTDLSLRGAAKGWTYRYDPRSVVRHGHGLSAGPGSALSRFCSERNRLVVIARHAPRRTALLLWAKAIADAIRATLQRDGAESRLRWRSIIGATRIQTMRKRPPVPLGD
jgi:GT2 family glycosyltransferase